jgi:nucleotide-binding universal stress UspA family protein
MRILVATDLTDGDHLVPYAVAQAKRDGAKVTLVHAILPANAFPIEPAAAPYFDQSMLAHEGRLMLLGIAEQIESQGVSCDVVLKHGFPTDIIREEINRTGATRLILGTHGRGKLGQLVLGSVANELLGSVDVPVFAVGPQAIAFPTHLAPKRILHAVSLMGDYKKSAEIAVDLARSYGAELTLLHVLESGVEDTVNPARTLTWAEKALVALKPMKQDGEQPIHTRVRSGDLVKEILTTANETNADWILLGVDGAPPFLPFRNSTAYKVIAAAKCPVLTTRHDHSRPARQNADDTYFSAMIIG